MGGDTLSGGEVVSSDWFTVSKDGLRQLQEGKPKHFVIRELVQNALDEAKDSINIFTEKDGHTVSIKVVDDGVGFRKLSDAHTLFDDTYKRRDAEKRGRFNMGEKQAFSVCKSAVIHTTSGTVTFNNCGRKTSHKLKRSEGTSVKVDLIMNQREFDDMHRYLETFIVPENIRMSLNDVRVGFWLSSHRVEASLPTELAREDGVIRRTRRKTSVSLYEHKDGTPSLLYEMGIPVTEIGVPFHVDVQQKVPLNSDRDMVSPAFLKEIYTIVLNNTFENIDEECVSENWVRVASASKDVSKEAFDSVIQKRFGENVCVATPTDPLSIDDALSNGFNVVRGSEMSKDEWENARRFSAIESSHSLFGHGVADCSPVKSITEGMRGVERLSEKIALLYYGVSIDVRFVTGDATVSADYGGRTLTFNVTMLGRKWFNTPLDKSVIDLIIHELGHERGHHTERAYHRAITGMGGLLVEKALRDPSWFDEVAVAPCGTCKHNDPTDLEGEIQHKMMPCMDCSRPFYECYEKEAN